MGEKPLGIDEAPAQMGTIAGGAPLGGVDVPPPAMAAGSINTTRSNIKHSGSAAAATQLPKGLEPTPTRPGDPFPDKPGQAGIAIKEQGVKVDGGTAGVGQTAEPVAMEGEPIPDIDVKLGKNAGGLISAAVPGAEVDDTPDGDELDPMAGAAGIITTRSNIKHSGSAAAATQLPKGLEPTPTRPGDPFPDNPGPAWMAIKEQGVRIDGAAAVPGAEVDDTPGGDELDPMAGATAVNTTRSNIKNAGSVVDAGSGSDESDTDPPPGIAVKEQGVKYDEEGGATPARDAPGVAGGSQPIPGVDIIVKSNPHK